MSKSTPGRSSLSLTQKLDQILVPAQNLVKVVEPGTTAVSDEINDLFDLAAPPLEKPVVARLVPSNKFSFSFGVDSQSDGGTNGDCFEGDESRWISSNTITIHMDSSCCSIGRSKELLPPFRIEHVDKISAKHCQLLVQPVTLRVYIRDISANGTFLNGQRLQKEKQVELQPGDLIQLTKPHLSTQEKNAVPRASVEYRFQRIKELRSLSSLVSSLTCPLCNQVFYRPCHVLPCLHTFCAHCLSELLQKQEVIRVSEGTEGDTKEEHSRVRIPENGICCPTCHQHLHCIRPSHNLETSVSQLLEVEPQRRPTAAKVLELEAKDTIPAGGLLLKRLRHAGSNEEYSYSEMDEREEEEMTRSSEGGSRAGSNERAFGSTNQRVDGLDGNLRKNVSGAFVRRTQMYYPQFLGKAFASCPSPCRECDCPSVVDGFQCGWTSSRGRNSSSGVISYPKHLQCRACWQPFPERPLCPRPQRCSLCAAPFCNLYFSSGVGEEKSGCPAMANGASIGLKSVEEHIREMDEGIPAITFAGNPVEQSTFLEYMVLHEIPEEKIRCECIKGFREGRWHPDVHSLSGAWTISSPVCTLCADKIYAGLLFHYRRSISQDDLPTSVTEKPHCWRGMQCRAQHQAVEHAERFYHVCYLEKRKE